MTKYKESDFGLFSERFDALPEARKQKIEAGARAIMEQMHLAEVRKALDVTQNTLSQRTGIKQAELSRIENNIETVQLKTLDRYVSGLGGTCKIVAEFPDGVVAEIPLRAGKPIKSKVKVASRGKPAADLDIAS
jgi:DNA-binding Xre family transcriptional regulator